MTRSRPQTGYVYDGDGRVIRQITYSYAQRDCGRPTPAYGGNYTTVTPPQGGTAQTTYTNGDGQTSYIYQYHSATPPAAPPAPGRAAGRRFGLGPDRLHLHAGQQLATITDAAGNHWSYSYDLAGDQVSATDAGRRDHDHDSYDADGNLLSATDARGKTISYGYDADGRKTAEYDTHRRRRRRRPRRSWPRGPTTPWPRAS